MGIIRDELEADHRRLDALLEAALLPDGRVHEESYTAFRSGLLRHIGIEEKILFAGARERRGEPLPLAKQLRIEHGALALLLVPTPDQALLAELRGLLDRHNALEEGEGGVYEQCEALLGDDPTVLEAIRTFPAPKMNRHYDGPNTYRRAKEALAASARQRFK